MQSTNHILMIRPVSFCKNKETAINNTFQKKQEKPDSEINKLAQKEFDGFVQTLKYNNVTVTVIEDTHIPKTPDALFPNNWVSFHKNGHIGVYPMYAPNRRAERREDIFNQLHLKGYHIEEIIDYSGAEEDNCFLEGTGSFVLDRSHEMAYCGLSERSDEELFIDFCEDFEYFPVVFDTQHHVNGITTPVYHTNVMLSITTHLAIICLDAIASKSQKKEVIKHLKRTKKTIIDISPEQMNNFCGNVLEVKNTNDQLLLVMSTTAFNSFTEEQKTFISKTNKIVHNDIATIETYGGGSARCMMAEIFLNLIE